MNKLILSLAMAVSGIALCAAEAEPLAATSNLTRRAERTRSRILESTGGKIRKPGVGKGSIVVYNTQARVKTITIDNALFSVVRGMRLPIFFKDGMLDGRPNREAVKKTGADFAIFLVDCTECESPLLVAPEDRWATVNVNALAKDDPEPGLLAERTRKEIVRAFGWLCGSVTSQSKATILSPVTTYKDLDRILLIDYPLDCYKRTLDYLSPMGVRPYVETTYRRACIEGWAPAPTNDVQKAIWDKVHEMPSKPLVIRPETKKVAE